MASGMTNGMAARLRVGLTCWAMALAGLGLVGVTGADARAQAKSEPARAQKDGKDAPGADAKKDVVIFRSGAKVEGVILEETETTVKMRVTVAGMSAETVYQKSEILQIERGSEKKDADKGADKGAGEKKDGTDPKKEPSKDAGKKDEAVNGEPGGPKVYIINMRGEFGRDVSKTSFRDVLEDVVKEEPDVLVLRFDHEFQHWGEQSMQFEQDMGSFDQLETARQMDALYDEIIADNPELKKKPRAVAWVNKAMGGAAFLPFTFGEVYFTPEGLHGGIGNLEHMMDGRGDERAREKQYSLRQKRGEGLAIKGGHDERILRAMARTNYVLSVKFEGGKPVFLERMPEAADEILLTDDGADANADAMQDVMRMRGNDTLTLDASTAERIGFSRGTAATLDDLMYTMGLPRNYVRTEGRGKKILEDWSKAVGKAEDTFRRLVREYEDVEVKAPGGFKERTAARGQRKSLLRQLKGLLSQYQEAINPARIRGYPSQLIGQIDWVIEQIDAAQRADKPD